MGPGHCGSTMLDLILGSHSSAMSFAELHTITRFVSGSISSSAGICSVCGDNCVFWNQKVNWRILKLFYTRRNLAWRALSKAARFCMSPYVFFSYWSGKNLLIDSSKNPEWFNCQLPKIPFPPRINPYLIYLVRDGRAIVNSYFRKYPERGLSKIIQSWMIQITRMNEYYENFDSHRKIKIHYEELSAYPEKLVRKICKFLEIPFEPKMLNYWEHEHHPINGNLGTYSLLFKKRQSPHICEAINQNDKYYDKQHYAKIGLAIKPDIRWKKEMTKEQLSLFDCLAGKLNSEFVLESILE